VGYGQPILYTKYRGMKFSDQKITSQFIRLNDHTIDFSMESVLGEFIKSFDSLASTTTNRVNLGIDVEKNSNIDHSLSYLIHSYMLCTILHCLT
jgi:hypothetical protein